MGCMWILVCLGEEWMVCILLDIPTNMYSIVSYVYGGRRACAKQSQEYNYNQI